MGDDARVHRVNLNRNGVPGRLVGVRRSTPLTHSIHFTPRGGVSPSSPRVLRQTTWPSHTMEQRLAMDEIDRAG